MGHVGCLARTLKGVRNTVQCRSALLRSEAKRRGPRVAAQSRHDYVGCWSGACASPTAESYSREPMESTVPTRPARLVYGALRGGGWSAEVTFSRPRPAVRVCAGDYAAVQPCKLCYDCSLTRVHRDNLFVSKTIRNRRRCIFRNCFYASQSVSRPRNKCIVLAPHIWRYRHVPASDLFVVTKQVLTFPPFWCALGERAGVSLPGIAAHKSLLMRTHRLGCQNGFCGVLHPGRCSARTAREESLCLLRCVSYGCGMCDSTSD